MKDPPRASAKPLAARGLHCYLAHGKGATVDLHDILRCPRCKARLAAKSDAYECAACRLRYPVREGIAMFIAADAEPLTDAKAGTSKQ